jgi:hypothetical protein
MGNDGVWLRCSRCEHLFFQVKPQILDMTQKDEDIIVRGRETSRRQKLIQGEGSDRDELSGSGEKRRAGGSLLTDFFESSGSEQNAAREDKLLGDLEDTKRLELSYPTSGGRLSETGGNYRSQSIKFPQKNWKRIVGLSLTIITLIVLLLGASFLVFPNIGQQVVKEIYLRVPAMENVFSVFKKENFSLNQVKLVNVRQKFIRNAFLGYVRVVEGSVINKSSFPITRIQVAALIYDAYDIVLGEEISYCGNTLNETELGSFTEDEIRKTLSLPQGSDVSDDRIDPNGQIPFMIVFTRDPGGVSKIIAKPVGAERLLQ